jgi:tetratricopeptide (TPR) repeat protein
VRCSSGVGDHRAAFEHAEGLAPDAAGLWQARAECALKQGDNQLALAAARKALELDPELPENTHLLCLALSRLGKASEAERTLNALRLARPELSRAARWHTDLFGGTSKAERARASLAALDAELLAAEHSSAQRHAQDFGLSHSELTARALALGQRQWAQERARVALEADPSHLEAQLLVLIAADLQLDRAHFESHSDFRGQSSGEVTPLTHWLFAELLLRRFGWQAARAWLRDTAEPGEGDELLTEVVARVNASLARAEALERPQATD